MPFAIGEMVGPYQIMENLGQGGMATVHRGHHAALDRDVAIKALHPALKDDPTFIARFQREAQVVARLEHPNIVPVFDYAEHQGQPYLVMKYIKGETLKSRLGRGPLGQAEGLKLARSVGSALAHAHQQGVLHRDIKPSNILIDAHGEFSLADFGLARIAASGASTMSGDMLMGTPQYISPEQGRGERQLSPGTDIYSFAVVLYEIVVGRVPFNAPTPYAIIHDHIYSPLPLPRDLNPKVPEAVERVLLKALAKSPSERYLSATEMLNAFCAAVECGDETAVPAQHQGSGATPTRVAAPKAWDTLPAPGDPLPGSSSQVDKRAAKRWPWVASGLILSCLVLGFFALMSLRSWQQGRTTATAEPLRTGEPVPLSVVDARGTAVASPEDPASRLLLAEALIRSGLLRQALDEVKIAAEMLLLRGEYYEAALALSNALKGVPSIARQDRQLLDLAGRAFWLGAADERMSELLLGQLERGGDWPALRAASARALLLQGEHQRAQRQLDQILNANPKHPLGLATQAELYAAQGDGRAASAVVDELLKQTDLPDWLTEHLRGLQTEIENLE